MSNRNVPVGVWLGAAMTVLGSAALVTVRLLAVNEVGKWGADPNIGAGLVVLFALALIFGGLAIAMRSALASRR